ncbi:MAG: hypothetical protein R2828_32730 [Saprospiraceae bacterium]
MKKLILISLIILAMINVYGQGIESGSLWQAEMVYDTLDNKLPREKIQRFMYFENENEISTLTIYEKMSMTNGEVIISYLVEANNLEKKSDTEYKVKEFRVDNFKLINNDSIFYKEKYFSLGFKRIDVKQSSITESQLMDFLFSSSVRKYYDNGESLNQIHTYKRNGNKAIQIVDSHSNWESDFRVFSFEGFLFLKGITSAPMIIEKLEDEKLIGKEVDYRFNVKNFEIRKEKL